MFYEDKLTKKCLKCHYTCNECKGPLESHCTSCKDDTFRELQEGKCKC